MMRLRQLLTMLLMVMFAISVNAQSWQLVWSDEFTNGIGPDWVFETGAGGWGNNELQYYRQQNAAVVNGQLVITAKNESFGGMNYTSARMKTQGKKSWKYGRIEASMQLPAFQGSWPAFWMLGESITSVGWPKCGEIDIMEQTNTSNTVLGTIHWDNNGYVYYGGNTGTNVTGFHLYAIEWDANEIRWYVDGNHYHTANIKNSTNGTNEFHENFFILLNLAVGGNLPGNNINNGALPSTVKVDYVRVYKASTTSTPVGQTVWIKGSNGKYASSENGQTTMNCNRNSVQGWEQFTVVDAGGGKIGLRGSNGQYVSSENGVSGMKCNRTTIGGWEAFDWVANSNGTFSLRGSNGQYVSSENGLSAMICNRPSIQGWEQFTWGTGNPSSRLIENTDDSGSNNAAELSIYPNPITNHTFNIQLPVFIKSNTELRLIDLTGRELFSTQLSNEIKSVSLPTSINKGSYILLISNGEQKLTRNVIIN